MRTILRRLRPSIRLAVVTALSFCLLAPAMGSRPVSAQTARAPLSLDLQAAIAASPLAPQPVIIQGATVPLLRAILLPVIGLTGLAIARDLPLVNGLGLTLPGAQILVIASIPGILRITLDRRVAGSVVSNYDANHLRATTGADQIVSRNGFTPATGDFTNYVASLPRSGYSGAGVGIAIVDSGIADPGTANHQDFGNLNAPSTSRIAIHANFVTNDSGTRSSYDPYGHGTHVAGIAAGDGRESLERPAAVGENVEYSGMAPNAKLIDVRVIGSDGSGSLSDSIAGIAWMIANKNTYNIRVANLSIGTQVVESYRIDPLCQAVQAAINAGIVCVVAAGNTGRGADGQTVYGGVVSPANLPGVIAVGAADTHGTNSRSDDDVAYFSSRGPTLVDGVPKPDICAPGVRIVSVASPDCYIAENYPSTVVLSTPRAGSTNAEELYLQMSGTSMASPVVAGAAALVVSANPSLNPGQVKAMLCESAQKMPSNLSDWENQISQGHGLLNVEGAVRLAKSVSQNAGSASFGTNLLPDDSALFATIAPDGSYITTIAGEAVSWGNRLVFSDGTYFARDAAGHLQIVRSNGYLVTNRYIMTNGYILTNGYIMTNRYIMTNGNIMTNGYIMTNRYIMTNGYIMTNSYESDPSTPSNPNSYTVNDVTMVQSVWGSRLVDQLGLRGDPTRERNTLVFGDDAPLIQIPLLTSILSALFPVATPAP